MPTGYTYNIVDGISFNEFAMQCARAFGACVLMRDEPNDAEIPKKFEIDTYHSENIDKANADIEKYANISLDDAQAEVNAYMKKETKYYYKKIKETEDQTLKFNNMLKETENWIPPTDDHYKMKDFMIEQIKTSMRFDCNPSYYELPKPITAEQWIVNRKEEAYKSLEYHAKEYNKEVERTNNRNQWLADLRRSLK